MAPLPVRVLEARTQTKGKCIFAKKIEHPQPVVAQVSRELSSNVSKSKQSHRDMHKAISNKWAIADKR